MNAVEKMPSQDVAEAAQPLSEGAAVLQIIERAARDPSVDIGKMRELLAMRNEMMAQEAKREYNKAMTAAQTEMLPVSVNASNPQTQSRYATFHALDGALRPIYTKHGFSLSFGTAEGAPEDCVRVMCQVSHAAGHVEEKHLDMPADGKGAKGGDVMTKTHATGAALTYGRRYLEGMIFYISIAPDDDGNGASKTNHTLIDAEQFRELQDLIEKSDSVEEKLLAYVKAESLEKLNITQFNMAVAAMNKMIAKKKAGAK